MGGYFVFGVAETAQGGIEARRAISPERTKVIARNCRPPGTSGMPVCPSIARNKINDSLDCEGRYQTVGCEQVICSFICNIIDFTT